MTGFPLIIAFVVTIILPVPLGCHPQERSGLFHGRNYYNSRYCGSSSECTGLSRSC